MLDRPNILFLSADALRADRTSLYGYERPTTLNIDALAETGILCSEAVSQAAFTQASFPSIMTSTSPLSYGGWDNGVIHRPKTLFEFFHSAGYRTSIFTGFKWVSRYYGYARGVDEEALLFAPTHLPGGAVNRIHNTVQGYIDGVISAPTMCAAVRPVLDDLFDQIEIHIAAQRDCIAKYHHELRHSILVEARFDPDAILHLAAVHRAEVARDVQAYVDKYLSPLPRSHEWLYQKIMSCREPTARLGLLLEKVVASFLRPILPQKSALIANRQKPYIDGTALADCVIRDLHRHGGAQPFMMYAHFLDTHKPYRPGLGRNWAAQAPHYLSELGYSADIDISVTAREIPTTDEQWAAWSALYDGAVHYVDEQIGRILQALSDSGHAENTLVVICGDHGEELGEHGHMSHYFRLYDHNVRVPMLFSHPSLKAVRIDGLTTLADIPPTLAALTGQAPDDAWQGKDVLSNEINDREVVVLETFYGGNCLFDVRPFYMAARDGQYNLIWKEALDPRDKLSPAGPELFDLKADPKEQRNLYSKEHPAIKRLMPHIIRRLHEMPEVSDARLEKNFGVDWRAKMEFAA